jgi:FeS assembly SUF system regulator
MLRLNRMTDYAVVVLGQMARQPGLVQTAAHIAEGTAIPLPTASKLLKQMAGSTLITSHRGANGGYSLDRPAEDVKVSEIVEALDGPIALTACVDGAEDHCVVESLCPMRGNWNRVNNAIREALESVSLAELIDPTDMFPLLDAQTVASAPDKRH